MMKELTIIWLNKKEARIITVTPGQIVRSLRIDSSDFPSSNHTSPQAKKENSNKKEYFEAILTKLIEPREIVLFGPDNSKEELLEFISIKHPSFFSKVIAVESSSDVPDDKLIARGRKYI
jgi:stalled ribosome rescue protein Dom34